MSDFKKANDALKRLLRGKEESHAKLADWCYDFCHAYREHERGPEPKTVQIAEDIYIQWQLLLATTEEMQSANRMEIAMPTEWVKCWLDALGE